MNPQLTSYLRHIFTGWIASIVTLAAAYFVMTPEESKGLGDALGQIGAGVLLVLTTMAPVIGRWAWARVARFFQPSAARQEDDQVSRGGGALGIWVIVGTAVALCGVLPSCAPARASAVWLAREAAAEVLETTK